MRNAEVNRLIARIRSVLSSDAVACSCSRDGCDVSMRGLPTPFVIADMDAHSMDAIVTGKRPDFVVFLCIRHRKSIELVGVSIELNSGIIDPIYVAEQLQQGARFLEDFTEAVDKFRPVLVYGGRISSRQFKLLNRQKVKFQNKGLTI